MPTRMIPRRSIFFIANSSPGAKSASTPIVFAIDHPEDDRDHDPGDRRRPAGGIDPLEGEHAARPSHPARTWAASMTATARASPGRSAGRPRHGTPEERVREPRGTVARPRSGRMIRQLSVVDIGHAPPSWRKRVRKARETHSRRGSIPRETEERMHQIRSALKPGVLEEISAGAAAPATPPERRIRGEALIFWDPKVPGKKLDAIDTDQITPAADCVSESLETLDERWKAGSFRYLMPDFRRRVHAGQTFVVAGDRFAIGSSREMSPAGPEGRGGRSRPRARRRLRQQHGRHLPPQRVQPRACTSCRAPRRWRTRGTATSSRSIPDTRELVERDAGKDLHAGPALAEGGGDPPERRHLRGRTARVSRVRAPRARDRLAGRGDGAAHDDDRADRLGASRRQGRARCGPARRCACTRTCSPRPTGPPRSRSTRSTRSPAATRSIRARRRSRTTISSSRARTPTSGRRRSAGSSRGSRRSESPGTPTRATASSISTFPEQGLVLPGMFIPGADSHSRAYGAYGAVGFGVGSTTLGFGWATGAIYFTVGEAAPRRVPRKAPALGQRQGHRARAAPALGSEAVAGHVRRVRGRGDAARRCRTATRSRT